MYIGKILGTQKMLKLKLFASGNQALLGQFLSLT